jgi:DNA polymerase-3 subunit delta'
VKNEFKEQYPWLKPSCQQLSSYINQNRIPQALLITGNKGLGKQQLALFFSQTLLCGAPLADGFFCGTCHTCTLFNAKTHPDFFLVEPEERGKEIGIAVIRQLITKLALKPQLESHRVVVINLADNLNKNSANAFLKYLEEPTERTSLILLSEKPSKLLATIKSRCQKISLSIPDQTIVKTWCEDQGIVENVELLLNLSQGAPLQIKQFLESDVLKLRRDCFTNWSKVIKSDSDFIALAEQWTKLDKETMELLLFWMISWVSDMVKLVNCQKTTALYNPDIAKNLHEMAIKLDLKDLYKYYDFLLLSRQKLDTQLNKQLMIEEILIQWLKLNSG